MWISEFKEENGFQAFKAASFGIQKLISKNFNNEIEHQINSIKKFGIVSSEVMELDNTKYLILFTSLMKSAINHSEYLGQCFKDYNSLKSFIISKNCGCLNKTLVIEIKEKNIKYEMPLELLVFEIKEINQSSKPIIQLFLDNNSFIEKLSMNKFNNFIDLLRSGLDSQERIESSSLNIQASKIISKLDFNLTI